MKKRPAGDGTAAAGSVTRADAVPAASVATRATFAQPPVVAPPSCAPHAT